MNFKSLGLITCFLSASGLFSQTNRSFDGTGNNISQTNWGIAKGHFRTYVSNGFSDSISIAGGVFRDNPRNVSNALGSQQSFMPNELGLSDFVWAWGQFIDHDINLNDDNKNEVNDIDIPSCEPMFDPNCTGQVKIKMFRSISDTSSGTSKNNPRRFINDITSYIDASAVYGSEDARADWLRTNTEGKLKVSAGKLLPWNTIDGEFGSAIDPSVPFMVVGGHPEPTKFFVAGDIRANEQPGLTAFHTLWVREHNLICDSLVNAHPNWNDELLFQRARKIVGAEMQVITYEEFLPNMGVQLAPYSSYDPTVNPNILNAFSAAAYRFGHTMLNGRLIRSEENGDSISFGAIDLRHGFFKPSLLKDEGGIAPYFRGLASQKHQVVDPLIMDDFRNFLFGPPGSGGLDLLSINIARARERGLPDYNKIRRDLGLSSHSSFQDLTSNDTLRTSLQSVYADINDVDPWIGFMSEDHLPNSLMGEGMHEILKLQFEHLRDGDRYYYENDPAFTIEEITALKRISLSKVVVRNTEVGRLQSNVFEAVPRHLLSIELFPFPEVSNIELKAYPNPVQKYFNLVITNSRPSSAILRIIDVNGKLVKEEAVKLAKGENKLNFELSDELANGLYTIILSSDGGQGELKLIKQK
ncbi:MAG: T9SS type A sorting domain-containing protein [Flavobacteriales bacterium]|nr:T9SS type A sorting domain-containing protein [Flavobacteriales bacterium]